MSKTYSLLSQLTGAGFMYDKSPRHASHYFNQESRSLYRNQPRVPFEFYVGINLNDFQLYDGTGTRKYIKSFFNSTEYNQIHPLVKSVEMPSAKINTDVLNQYNRRRMSQTKVSFEPIRMVFHDVIDGKVLKFWDMYYRYYFMEGNESGMNAPKQGPGFKSPMSLSSLVKSITPTLNPALANIGTDIKKLFNFNNPFSDPPTNSFGSKNALQNIVENRLDNHHFGYNLQQVGNVRELIQSIDIFQVHGGRFNQVRLVNPRIVSFNHDTLNYSTSDKTLEITLTIMYEYSYYIIQNMKLGGGESNNVSGKEFFDHGEILELPALAFNSALMDFVESNNPLLQSDNPVLSRIGKNTQSSLGAVSGAFLSDKVTRKASASALGALTAGPQPLPGIKPPVPVPRSFKPSIPAAPSTMFRDMNRIGKK